MELHRKRLKYIMKSVADRAAEKKENQMKEKHTYDFNA